MSCAGRNALPDCCGSCRFTHSGTAFRYPSPRARPTSTPSHPTDSPTIRAIATSSEGSKASFAGTPWRWWWRPTASRTASAATSPRTRRRPRCTRWALTTSSEDRITRTAPTSCTSKGTPRPGCMRGRTWSGGSPPRSCTTFGANWRTGAVCRHTPTRGSCPTSGSSRPCPWASGHSCPSTRLGSCSTWPIAICVRTPAGACGRSWAMANSIRRRPAGRSHWRLGSAWTI